MRGLAERINPGIYWLILEREIQDGPKHRR